MSQYPRAFRRKVLDLLKPGQPVKHVAADLGLSQQTVYNWRTQEAMCAPFDANHGKTLIDTGSYEGDKSAWTKNWVVSERLILKSWQPGRETKEAVDLPLGFNQFARIRLNTPETLLPPAAKYLH